MKHGGLLDSTCKKQCGTTSGGEVECSLVCASVTAGSCSLGGDQQGHSTSTCSNDPHAVGLTSTLAIVPHSATILPSRSMIHARQHQDTRQAAYGGLWTFIWTRKNMIQRNRLGRSRCRQTD
jgi:hypothetical protein